MSTVALLLLRLLPPGPGTASPAAVAARLTIPLAAAQHTPGSAAG